MKQTKLVVSLLAGMMLMGSAKVSAAVYEVEAGDTLYGIARKHGLTLDYVLAYNGIGSDKVIMQGDILYLPDSAVRQSSTTPSTATPSTPTPATAPTSTVYSDDVKQLLYAVVQQEGGYRYESALWVAGCILNRVDSSDFPNSIDGVITQPGQFESYGAGHYYKHLGNIGPEVKRAVDEVLAGARPHQYKFFWADWYASQQGQSGVNVGGNVFFNY